MSKIKIRDEHEHPKVTSRVDLVDYHRDLKGEFIDVWVNIDREMTRALQAGRFDALQIAQMPYATDEDMEARGKASDALVETMKQIHVRWFGLTREEVLAKAARATGFGQFRMALGNRIRGICRRLELARRDAREMSLREAAYPKSRRCR